MRVTTRRAAEIRSQLNPVDWQVIDTIDRVRIATASQLRRIVWPTPPEARTARRRLSHLVELRVISRLDRRVGGVRAGSDGYIYRLDVAGRRILGQPPRRRPHTPGRIFLDHAVAVTELYVVAVETSRTHSVEIMAYDTEPTCWRQWHAGVVKPDAYLATRTPTFDDHWFAEIDRATESTTTISHKSEVYERYYSTGIEQDRTGVFPRVLWVVPHDRRKPQIVETLARRRAEGWHLHRVVLASELSNLFKS